MKRRQGRVQLPKTWRFLRGSKSVFYDEFAVQFFDEEHSGDEDRFVMLGMSSEAKLLVVCHCEREDGDVIRIISARKATKREGAFYGGA
jgi:uncharacterized DUF497 family protein